MGVPDPVDLKWYGSSPGVWRCRHSGWEVGIAKHKGYDWDTDKEISNGYRPFMADFSVEGETEETCYESIDEATLKAESWLIEQIRKYGTKSLECRSSGEHTVKATSSQVDRPAKSGATQLAWEF